MVLNLDLNSPPMEGSSSSIRRRRATGESPMDCIDVDMEDELNTDLEANDNDVQILPPMPPPISREWNHGWNQPRIVRRVPIVPPAQPDLIKKYPDLLLYLNSLNSIHGSLSGKEVIHCEHCSGRKEVNFSEKNVESSSQIATPPPEEPAAPTCPVCISEFTDSCSTTCGHIFCENCISMSIKKFKHCPTCRKKLSMKNFHRVYLP